MTFGVPFEKGREKTGGRKPGARNRLSHAFLDAFAEDFEKHGIEVIKIVRMERPAEYLKVASFLMPKAYDDEHPPVLHIVTGVPRAGEDYQPPGPPRSPEIPPAFPDQLPKLVAEGDDASNDD